MLLRIKRLVVGRRVEFTRKAEEERLADGLTVEDVLESILERQRDQEDAAVAISGQDRCEGAPVRDREPDLCRIVGLYQGHDPR